uniref:Uncharacterized protein n=1 Tax=Onchocerca volvulus TaxID=6282 RepID=A0A8R1XVK5_ONCVO
MGFLNTRQVETENGLSNRNSGRCETSICKLVLQIVTYADKILMVVMDQRFSSVCFGRFLLMSSPKLWKYYY